MPGIKFTGWWPGPAPESITLECLKDVWAAAQVTIKLEKDILEDYDGQKHQLCAYVRIKEYPDAWLEVLAQSLRLFVDRGAAISWAGGWECFLQYSVGETLAGCYAAYTHSTGMICNGGLDDSVTYLSDVDGARELIHGGVLLALRS